jgi:adenylyltransferase/sulfurtransferase
VCAASLIYKKLPLGELLKGSFVLCQLFRTMSSARYAMATNEALPLEIAPAEVKRMLDAGEDFLLMDCREADEHATVNIKQATLLPMSELADRASELTPHRERRIVVHCHHGGRSMRVTKWLREQGFGATQSMAGGIDQWAIEIDPTLPRY